MPDKPWSGKKMESSKCPKCGDEPFYIEHVEKWYCYGCNTYVEEGEDEHVCTPEPAKSDSAAAIAQELRDLDEEPELICKNCGASLQNLKDGRLYCFMCESYQDDLKSEPEKEKPINEAQTLIEMAIPPVVVETAPEVIEPAITARPEAAPLVVDTPAVPEPELLVEAKPERHVEIKMCSTCGQPLKHIEKYQRHYCYGCRKYASKDAAPKPVVSVEKATSDITSCPDCGSALKYIEKYHEHYCYTCKKYPLKARKPDEAKAVATAKPEVHTCPKCGEPLKHIEKYQRHYCYSCKEYAPKGLSGHAAEPKEKKACPTCQEDMKYVAEYNEWYCLKCKKYSLRPSKPVLLF